MINCLTLTDKNFDHMGTAAYNAEEAEYQRDPNGPRVILYTMLRDLVDVVRSQNALLQRLAERAAITAD